MTYPVSARIEDALSYICGQTVAAIAARADTSVKEARSALVQLYESGCLEKNKDSYRIANGIEWVEAVDPLPPAASGHRIDYNTQVRSKYAVSIPEPRPVEVAKAEDPIDHIETPVPDPSNYLKEGQLFIL